MSKNKRQVKFMEEVDGELRTLRIKHKRLKSYLAIAQYELERSKEREVVLNSEGRLSRRKRLAGKSTYRQWQRRSARKRALGQAISPPPQLYQSADVKKKIESYEERIRRTQTQLMLAAAAGHQFREITLATRQGRLISGIHPNARRKHRAFEARRDSSLTSNEAAARKLRGWFNEERARRRQGRNKFSHDGRVSLDSSSDDNSSSSGDILAKTAKATIASMINGTNEDGEKEHLAYNGPSSGRPNVPLAPNPSIYNPNRWNASYLNISGGDENTWYKQPQDERTPTGWLTWKEMNENYPTLDKVIKSRPITKLWSVTSRLVRERNLKEYMKRPRLEPNILTKLSIERAFGLQFPQGGSSQLSEYSQHIYELPEKLSDEQMRSGPLPTPPALPLQGPNGPEIDLKPKTPHATRSDSNVWKGLEDPGKRFVGLPAPEIQYDTPDPNKSTVRFPDGQTVADTMRPAQLDEAEQLRGSQTLINHGEELAKRPKSRKRTFVAPPTIDPVPPPTYVRPASDPPQPLTAEQQAKSDKRQSELQENITRIQKQWEDIQRQREKATMPVYRAPVPGERPASEQPPARPLIYSPVKLPVRLPRQPPIQPPEQSSLPSPLRSSVLPPKDASVLSPLQSLFKPPTEADQTIPPATNLPIIVNEKDEENNAVRREESNHHFHHYEKLADNSSSIHQDSGNLVPTPLPPAETETPTRRVRFSLPGEE